MIKKYAYLIYLFCTTVLIELACYVEKSLIVVMNSTYNGNYRLLIYLLFFIIGIVFSMQYDLSKNSSIMASSIMNVIFAIINLILFSFPLIIGSEAVVYLQIVFSGLLIYQALINILKCKNLKHH